MSDSTVTADGPGHPPTEDCQVQADPQMQTSSEGMIRFASRHDLHTRLSSIQRQEEILQRIPAPAHWKAARVSDSFGRLRRTVFNALCLTSFGHAGLEPIWAAIKLAEEGDESAWNEGIRQTTDRLNNMLVVAGLLLATTAVFITTVPPRAPILDYTLRGPYMCLLAWFGMFIGGIIVASVCVLATSKARPYWSEEVLYADRFHVYSTLIMLSYPFFSFGTAALLLAFGVLNAIWYANDLGVKGGSAIILIGPISIAVLFGVSFGTVKAKSRLRKETADMASFKV